MAAYPTVWREGGSEGVREGGGREGGGEGGRGGGREGGRGGRGRHSNTTCHNTIYWIICSKFVIRFHNVHIIKAPTTKVSWYAVLNMHGIHTL